MSGHSTKFFSTPSKDRTVLYLSIFKSGSESPGWYEYVSYLPLLQRHIVIYVNVWFSFFSRYIIVEGQFFARQYNYFVLIFMLLQ